MSTALSDQLILPAKQSATVAEEKITKYLLAESHEIGKHKCKFFKALGFAPESWEVMADALKGHAQINKVVGCTSSDFGTKYVVECTIETPNDDNPCVRTVWIIKNGEMNPLLVTAYPLNV